MQLHPWVCSQDSDRTWGLLFSVLLWVGIKSRQDGWDNLMAMIPFHDFMLHFMVLRFVMGFGCCCPIRRLSDGEIQPGQARGRVPQWGQWPLLAEHPLLPPPWLNQLTGSRAPLKNCSFVFGLFKNKISCANSRLFVFSKVWSFPQWAVVFGDRWRQHPFLPKETFLTRIIRIIIMTDIS